MGIQIKIPAHEHTLHIMHPSPEANQWLRDANMKMSGGEPSTGKRFIPPDRRRQQSEELEELMAIQEAELREVESTLRDINKYSSISYDTPPSTAELIYLIMYNKVQNRRQKETYMTTHESETQEGIYIHVEDSTEESIEDIEGMIAEHCHAEGYHDKTGNTPWVWRIKISIRTGTGVIAPWICQNIVMLKNGVPWRIYAEIWPPGDVHDIMRPPAAYMQDEGDTFDIFAMMWCEYSITLEGQDRKIAVQNAHDEDIRLYLGDIDKVWGTTYATNGTFIRRTRQAKVIKWSKGAQGCWRNSIPQVSASNIQPASAEEVISDMVNWMGRIRAATQTSFWGSKDGIRTRIIGFGVREMNALTIMIPGLKLGTSGAHEGHILTDDTGVTYSLMEGEVNRDRPGDRKVYITPQLQEYLGHRLGRIQWDQ